MTSSVRTIEERGGAWLRIVLNRPPGNLLSLEMVRALTATLDQQTTRRKWMTFEGAGDEFSFGAMIQEHVPGPMEAVLPETHALFRHVLALPAATAAIVQGRCLGGAFELALACDGIIADDNATLGLPEIHLGAFPPAGVALLPLRIGAARAASSVITGEPRSASAWREAGLIETVAPRGRAVDAARQWFDAHLAPRSAVAVAAAAQASRLVIRTIAEPAIAAAEKFYLERVLPSRDAREGVQAFIEKRPPQWTDS
jgi:cyclohexa-1,5-dienecarbonyl-CoA hydratase